MNLQYFSSSLAVDKDRCWEDIVNQLFGAVDMSIADSSGFAGQVSRASLGGLELCEVSSDYEVARRTATHIARDRRQCFVLVLLRSGSLHVVQRGRECNLLPGMFVLFDLSTPYTYAHKERADVLDIKIPHSLLVAHLKDPYRFVATTRSALTGAGRITASFLSSLAGELSALPESNACTYGSRIVDLASLLFETSVHDVPIGQSAVRAALYRRCISFIESQLADPDLNPEKIAAALGISVRYLHKIFQGSDESVGDLVRRKRLERARQILVDAGQASLPVKEVAFRTGFRTQAHFATAFKQIYGVSPSEVRQLAPDSYLSGTGPTPLL